MVAWNGYNGMVAIEMIANPSKFQVTFLRLKSDQESVIEIHKKSGCPMGKMSLQQYIESKKGNENNEEGFCPPLLNS